MGKGRGKGKKSTLTHNDDPGSGEEERMPAQKRRGRPQKPLLDEIDQDFETIEDKDHQKSNVVVSNNDTKAMDYSKKRKRNKQTKETHDLVKVKEEVISTQSNGFRHNGSRRKNKPHRAAEAGVECK